MSAVIIEFVRRPKQRTRFFDFPVPTRSAFRTDDLTMGHADAPARCENVLSIDEYRENRDATQLTRLRHSPCKNPAVDRAETGPDAGEPGELSDFEMLAETKTSHDDRADRNKEGDEQEVGRASGCEDAKIKHIPDCS
jgi:hypothetical protein